MLAEHWEHNTYRLTMTMLDMFGPYETRAAAEAFIRKDFADWWEDSETPLKDRDESSCGTYQILELVAEVRPVGTASLKVKLVEESAK
jgi:hypothetical protein